MAMRTFGAVRGAGTQLNEVTGNEEVQLGALGSTVLVGVMERGAENDIVYTRSPRELSRRCGGLLDPADHDTPVFATLETPLQAQQFHKRAKGAGPLVVLRVCPSTNDGSKDDRPSKSTVDVFNREEEPVRIGYLEANNGGNWGGKRKVYISDLSGVVGADFPATNQIQLRGLAAKTLKRDEFKNGTVYLDGLPGTTYRIVNNTTLGLLTLEADKDVITDWGTGGSYGSESSDAETFDLGTVAQPWTLTVTSETGGPDTATIAATKANITNGTPPVFAMVPGNVVFTLSKDGGTTTADYTVAFVAEGTLAAVLATLNAGLPGCSAEDDGGGNVIVYTDQLGSGAYLVINDAASTAATVNCVFGSATPAETAGTGDVANHFEATAHEIQVDTAAVIALGASAAVATDSGGILSIRSSVFGAAGTVQMGGSIATLLGFDGAVHTGTDGPADLGAIIEKDNLLYRGVNKSLAVEFKDGGLRRDTEFGMIIYVDGEKILSYENLSMESDKTNYWVDVINDDANNDIVVAYDSFTGDRTVGSARPANHFGNSKTLTTTRLTIADPTYTNLNVGAGAWVPTLTWGSWGSLSKPQRLRITMTAPNVIAVTTDQGNETWAGTIGVAVDMGDFVGTMTITTASGAVTNGDYFDIYLKPLEPDECIGGKVWPDVEDASKRNQNWGIIDNGVSYVDISPLGDLTDGGTIAAGKQYRIEYKQQAGGGYDGYIAGMTTTDYERLLDSATTPLTKLVGKGLGQVKLAAPGCTYITSGLALQQKLRRLAYDMNWMARNEFPWSYHDWDVYYEQDLCDWVENTLGRNEESMYSRIDFPSYCYIADPLAVSGSVSRLKLVSVLGMMLGEEARIAKQYGNHHKAPAGTNAKLPDILKLPVVGKPDDPVQLDHEILNPSGINILKWKGNNVIIWGDRTLSQTDDFVFYHKRNLLSQYEHDVLEGFDFSIFEINDPINDSDVIAALMDYFKPEWVKRAIRGKSFVGGSNPAAEFNMGADVNTDTVRGAGDVKCEIALRLADVVERLRFYIGAMGVVEGSSA